MSEHHQPSRNEGARAALRLGLRGLAGAAIICAVVVFLGQSALRSAGVAPPAAPLSTDQGFGYTLDALTGNRVAGVTVTVDGQSFVSDATGVYKLSGLVAGQKIAVVSLAGRVPNAFHFSVHQSDSGATSVHTPPAYMLTAQPATAIPAEGGTLTHGLYSLSFSSGGFDASLTGFGEHPGAPAPPDAIPTIGSPLPPRPPILGQASADEHAFPQALFYATFLDGNIGQVQVPLSVAGADPAGSLLPLLRFDTATAL